MSKKLTITKFMIFVVIIIITLILSNSKVNAKNELNNDPYNTYTVGLDQKLVSSPLAYEGVFVINPGFNDPRDIYIDKNDFTYICDKGNKVIYIYNPNTEEYKVIGEKELVGPTGVTTDEDNNIYVADYDGKCVVKFDSDGNQIKKYLRPTEALFGENSQFRPTKVVVDRRKNLYITSDGNSNGIIQLNEKGEFMGYFGPNNVKLTLSLFMKRLILSKEDRETYASLTPKPTTNLAIDNKNIIYTIIEGETGASLKKYNVSGTNILPKNSFFSNTYQDIFVDKNGFIYTVDTSSTGAIQVMDQEGSLLFKFGNTKNSSFSMGEFDKAKGISVDSKGNIWVLDGGGKNVQVFMKTEFTNTVMKAILCYNRGLYDEATIYYQEILEQNASFVNAYVGLGKISQRLQDYEKAIEYFKIANYKNGYSDVYWELRDKWLNNNIYLILVIIVLIILLKIFKVKDKINPYTTTTKDKMKKLRIIQELSYLVKILRKPNDVFYDVKYLLKVRIKTALIIFVIFILINIFGDYFIRGYLYRSNNIQDINFAFVLLRWGLIIVLFVIGNYLISTLQSGEGFFRDIFIGTILSFSPIILFKLPIDVISNFLTYNEAYIYNILNSVLWIWSIVNLLLMIKEIHNYTLKELILNVLLTFVAVIILVLLYLVMYLLTMQLVEFIIGLISESGART